jgi:hypothetical protein
MKYILRCARGDRKMIFMRWLLIMSQFMKAMVVIILTVTLGPGSLWATGGVDVAATRGGQRPNGPGYVLAADYGTPSRAALLAAQVAAAGTRQIVLTPGTWTIGRDTTITSPLKLMPGAVLTRSGGDHLYINGTFECGLHVGFSDNSANHDWVKFGPGAVKEVYCEWWGGVGDNLHVDTNALQSAVRSGRRVKLLDDRTYRINAGIIIPPYGSVEGAGKRSVIHQVDNTKEGLIVCDDVTVKNCQLLGSQFVWEDLPWPAHFYHTGIVSFSFSTASVPLNDAAHMPAADYLGRRITVANVYFSHWYDCIVIQENSAITKCHAIDNICEAFMTTGTGNQITCNYIENLQSWGIDVNGGNTLVGWNTIKNVGQRQELKGDGGGICINGLGVDRPLENIKIIDNNIIGVKYGWGILASGYPGLALKNLKIERNNLYGAPGCPYAGIYVNPKPVPHPPPKPDTYAPCEVVVISENIIDSFKGGVAISRARGITCTKNRAANIKLDVNGAFTFAQAYDFVISDNYAKVISGESQIAYLFDADCGMGTFCNNLGSARIGLQFGSLMAGTGMSFINNNFADCPGAGVILLKPLQAGNKLMNNLGYHPGNGVGPTLPASDTPLQNILGYPVMITLVGGSVSDIKIGASQPTIISTGQIKQVNLPAGWYISVTYTGTPAWAWEGIQ